MAINDKDGEYAISCWEITATEYSNDPDELKRRTLALLKGGRFGFVQLRKWNSGSGEFDEIDMFDTDDLDRLEDDLS